MVHVRARFVLATLLASCLFAGSASAQVFGTYVWQMQPYCNVVSLTITQFPGGYTVDGTDNQCGAGTLAAATGQLTINPNGSVGVGFAIVTSPGGKVVHVSAVVSTATGSGTWTDSVGNSGTFALGVNTGGSPRLLPASGVSAGSITTTELAAAAVGVAQVNTAQVQARVSGTCPAGQAVNGVNADGTVVCQTTSDPSVQFKVGLTPMAIPTGQSVITSWSAAPVYNLGGGTYTASAGTYLVPSAGLYLLTASVGLVANPGEVQNRCVFFAIDIAPDTGDCREAASANQVINTSTVVSLTAGQSITVRVQNNTTAATGVLALGLSGFSVTRLR